MCEYIMLEDFLMDKYVFVKSLNRVVTMNNRHWVVTRYIIEHLSHYPYWGGDSLPMYTFGQEWG